MPLPVNVFRNAKSSFIHSYLISAATNKAPYKLYLIQSIIHTKKKGVQIPQKVKVVLTNIHIPAQMRAILLLNHNRKIYAEI
jgi:hypothetical protein